MSDIKLVTGKIIRFAKRETVLTIACASAAISACFVRPSAEYLSYIDFKVLACLFCLMGVVSGLRKTGLFDRAAAALTRHTTSLRAMSALLVGTTFVVSMFITNDVALITFVPFSLLVLRNEQNSKLRIRIIVLQTVAANVGSSLTPVGNPQNLFLFSHYQMDSLAFFAAIAPVVAFGSVLLAMALFSVPAMPAKPVKAGPNYHTSRTMVLSYFALFVASVLAVFRIIDYRFATLAVLAFLLAFDRSVIRRIDYSLLFTFIGFFIFIGNLRRIDAVNAFVTSIVSSDVTLVSALASQAISNVPAAIFLSGFTDDSAALLRGVSIGGMGTLIASLASVISFKFFSRDRPAETMRYLLSFTFWNILFLALLLVFSAIVY
jgi:Na+/H+ antiporter NhaD/arsenite permease-like protein